MQHRHLHSCPDADLVRASLESQPMAFEILVSRHRIEACAIARAMGIRSAGIENIIKEASLRSLERLSELRESASFGPWFLEFVRSVARSRIEQSRSGGVPWTFDRGWYEEDIKW